MMAQALLLMIYFPIFLVGVCLGWAWVVAWELDDSTEVKIQFIH
jgi:hypothetical protein